MPHQAPGTGKTDLGDRLTVDIGIDFSPEYGSDEVPTAGGRARSLLGSCADAELA
ncbi:hypothetical protein ACH41H_37295 [Streptomyces sp. NPDC020800]|uniref:hypothetical protein n=1 Tax=Streptomyces sp. NPDC020800 TaxID=3365092 RepID=UPI00378B05F9